MNIASVKPGDIVRVDKKGRRFHAEVTDRTRGALTIMPLQRNITYREAKAREVIGIWHKSRQKSRATRQEEPDAVEA